MLHDSALGLALKIMVTKNKWQFKQSVAQPELVKLSREASLRGSVSLFWSWAAHNSPCNQQIAHLLICSHDFL